MNVVIFFKTMSIKTIIRFGLFDILYNQGLGKCYQPGPSARLIPLTSTVIIPDITNPRPIIVYYQRNEVGSGDRSRTVDCPRSGSVYQLAR